MTSPTKSGISRRRVLTGAAWSAPVVVASAAVPAYAASRELVVEYSAFSQAFDLHPDQPFSTKFGADSVTVPLENSFGSSENPKSNGGGNYTPGGSLGDNTFGGVGFWLSAPLAPDGSYAGTSTLKAGSTFYVSYTIVFAKESEVRAPETWGTTGEGGIIPAFETHPGMSVTANPSVKAFNGAAYSYTFLEPTINTTTWDGDIQITLLEDLSVSSTNGKAAYNQLVFSQIPILYSTTSSTYSLTVEVRAGDSPIEVTPASGSAYSATSTNALDQVALAAIKR